MRIKLILVEPKYQINLGSIARVAKNFGIERLHVVNPRAKLTGMRAIMFSKHAHQLLENAKVYNSFNAATRDCDILIGTTGLWRRSKANFYNIGLAETIARRVSNASGTDSTVGILIGRDDTGLNREEMEKCDFIAYIGTNPDYPVLNISHSIAILLYVFTKKEYSAVYSQAFAPKSPEKKEMSALFRIFDSTLRGKKIRNAAAVKRVFRRVIRTSNPSGEEVRALITGLK